MRTSRLGKEVVLVAGCLQVLVPRRLHVLLARDLYLNVWSVGCLFGQVLLLASGAVEVLSRLIHKWVIWCASHSQVHMLSRAAPCRPCPSLWSVVPVALHAFNKLSCFRIYFSEGVNGVICNSSALICIPVARDSTLNESPVPCPTFRRVWHSNCLVVKVDLTTTSIVHIGLSGAETRCWLVEATVNCRIHTSVLGTGHLSSYVISTNIVRLCLTTTAWPGRWHCWDISIVTLRKYRARLLRLGLVCVIVYGWSQGRVPIDLLLMQGERGLVS